MNEGKRIREVISTGKEIIIALTLDRDRIQTELRGCETALHDLLDLWDRREDSAWTAADVELLRAIRMQVTERSMENATQTAADSARVGGTTTAGDRSLAGDLQPDAQTGAEISHRENTAGASSKNE